MNNHTLIAGFSAFALFAIASTVLLFQTTTMQANVIDVPEFNPILRERHLTTEKCKILPDVPLGMSKEDCTRITRIECSKLYSVKINFKGDSYAYNNCLNKCIRDARQQCQNAFSAFFTGER